VICQTTWLVTRRHTLLIFSSCLPPRTEDRSVRLSFPDVIWQCTVLYLRARHSVLICHHVLVATDWFCWHCTVVLQQQCDNATSIILISTTSTTTTTDLTLALLSLCHYWLSVVLSWCWRRSLEVQCCSRSSGWNLTRSVILYNWPSQRWGNTLQLLLVCRTNLIKKNQEKLIIIIIFLPRVV